MSEVAYEIAVVCEARADQETACVLADRVLLEAVPWLDGILDMQRRWRGISSAEPHLEWKHVHREAESRNVQIFGFFNGEPGAPDAFVARRALLLLEKTRPRPAAVLLIRDSDNQERRRKGLEQARSAEPWRFPVIIGVASPEREAWIVAGFEAKTRDEERRLQELTKRLSFHPVLEAHRLSTGDRDSKAVLEELSRGDKVRERECLEETPLAVLRERGTSIGLSDYLKEISERLVPILGGRAPQQ
jgi:hypothetical protein